MATIRLISKEDRDEVAFFLFKQIKSGELDHTDSDAILGAAMSHLGYHNADAAACVEHMEVEYQDQLEKLRKQ